MKNILGWILKICGILLILGLLAGYGFYQYLFEKEYKYYEVEDPQVKAKLNQWQDLKFGLFMHWELIVSGGLWNHGRSVLKMRVGAGAAMRTIYNTKKTTLIFRQASIPLNSILKDGPGQLPEQG